MLQENNLTKGETRRPCRTKNDRTAGRVVECSEQQSSGIMRERGRVRQRERLEIVGVIPWPSVALSPALFLTLAPPDQIQQPAQSGSTPLPGGDSGVTSCPYTPALCLTSQW